MISSKLRLLQPSYQGFLSRQHFSCEMFNYQRQGGELANSQGCHDQDKVYPELGGLVHINYELLRLLMIPYLESKGDDEQSGW